MNDTRFGTASLPVTCTGVTAPPRGLHSPHRYPVGPAHPTTATSASPHALNRPRRRNAPRRPALTRALPCPAPAPAPRPARTAAALPEQAARTPRASAHAPAPARTAATRAPRQQPARTMAHKKRFQRRRRTVRGGASAGLGQSLLPPSRAPPAGSSSTSMPSAPAAPAAPPAAGGARASGPASGARKSGNALKYPCAPSPAPGEPVQSPPPPSRTKWTRRVPPPILIVHAASHPPY